MPSRAISFLSMIALLAAALIYSYCARAASTPETFTFTKIDLDFLKECDALDLQLEHRGLVYYDPALEAHIAALAQPLLPASPPEKVEWHFRILRDPTPNAFALANGSVYIHTGLLSLLENDDQLTGILAHELTHVVARHGFKENRDNRNKVAGLQVLAVATAYFTGSIFGELVSDTTANQYALRAAVRGYYSDEREHEADANAVVLMKQVGRDPVQLARSFELLDERLDPKCVPIFFLDHPKLQQRIEYVKSTIGVATINAPAGRSIYYESFQALIRYDIEWDMESRRFRTAVARSQRLLAAHPGDPEDLSLAADALRALGPRTPKPSQAEQTDSALRAARKKNMKLTEQEEEDALARTPEGSEALTANQSKAEELYRQAILAAPHLARPHFGLGALYEQQGKTAQALAEYRKFVEMAPDTPDARRLKYRIERLSNPK